MLLYKNTGQLLLGTVLGLTIGLTLSQFINGDFLIRTSSLTGQAVPADCEDRADVDCNRGCYWGGADGDVCSGTCSITNEPCVEYDAGDGFPHCGGCGAVCCNSATKACQAL